MGTTTVDERDGTGTGREAATRDELLELLDRERARRTRAVNRFRRLRDEVRQVEDSVSAAIIALDTERRVVRWNRVASDLLGRSRREMRGRLVTRDVPAIDEPETLERVLDQVSRERRTVRVEQLAFQRADGSSGLLGVTVSPVLGDDGAFGGYFLLGQDITSHVIRSQDDEQHARLEAIGRLAAGIAHELNTPIQYVGDNVRFLDDAFKTLRPVIELLAAGAGDGGSAPSIDRDDLEFFLAEIPGAIEQSLEGVDRVTRIVRAMKEFSHPSRKEKVHADLNKALTTTITVARTEWKYVAEIETDLDPELPSVPCLPGELNQVFLNLIVNAAHAIGDARASDPERAGRITISTRHAGDSVVIRIADNGCGIPDGLRHKIFEPFFTTKEVGRGTGQGLAIVMDVIRNKHGGAIDVETVPGTGTTFVLTLPLTTGEADDDSA